MQQFARTPLLLCAVAIATAFTTACDSTTEPAEREQSVDVYVGSHIQALAIDRGAGAQLLVESRDQDGQLVQANPAVTFFSRNPLVVGVTSTGAVTGLAAGKTYVVAKLDLSSGRTLLDSIAVTVVDAAR